MKIYTNNDVTFVDALACVAIAQKFTFWVPNWSGNGEPLVYPPGHPEAGKLVCNYKGVSLGTPDDRGFVWTNPVDKKVQAVKANGTAVIILNEVTPERASVLAAKILEFTGGDPERLDYQGLQSLIEWAYQNGFTDVYDTSVEKANESFVRVGEAFHPTARNFGLFQRAGDVCAAIYIAGPHKYDNGSGDPKTRGEEGGVVVQAGNRVRSIDPAAFLRTYANSDRSPISGLSAIPRFQPKES